MATTFANECVCGARFSYTGIVDSAYWAWGQWIKRHANLYPESPHRIVLSPAEKMVMDSLDAEETTIEGLRDNSDFDPIMDALRTKLVLARRANPRWN